MSSPFLPPNISRRRFLRTVTEGGLGVMAIGNSHAQEKAVGTDVRLESRIRGLLIGSLIGDALGGPVEFQQVEEVAKLPNAPHRWKRGEKLNAQALAETEGRLQLRPYAPLRPTPEPYGHWLPNAPAGTVTDDSRHKFILLQALRHAVAQNAWPVTARSLARAFIEWPTVSVVKERPEYRQLCDDWLEEFLMAARWLQGEREPSRALPPERMWVGLPTCCGQMVLPPLAAVFPGEPDAAYRAAYALSFFDNGFGKDLNAALIAGLVAALGASRPTYEGKDWQPVLTAMRATDPFRYGAVPWTKRPADRYLDIAQSAAQRANGEPAALFAELDGIFENSIKWQAEVPFVIALSVIALCPDNPRAALQLSIEWGHDTDSYASLVGAFIGARYGFGIFPEPMRTSVEKRLKADFDESLEEWIGVLGQVAKGRGAVPICAFE